MTALTPEDIAAAREEGDLVALLLMAAGLTPAVPKQRTAELEPDRVHVAHPGAWPTGATRPTAVPTIPASHVEAALTDYRRWLVADRPAASTKCPCPGCTPGGTA